MIESVSVVVAQAPHSDAVSAYGIGIIVGVGFFLMVFPNW
ncbi:MAG: hypothetical protein ACJA07_003925 [Rhodococcus sp. (in: high G+C Gram-positive bacteria)]